MPLLLQCTWILCKIRHRYQALRLSLTGIFHDLSRTAKEVICVGYQICAGIHHALIRFDADRAKAALDALQEEPQNKKVILFTCQSREKELIK